MCKDNRISWPSVSTFHYVLPRMMSQLAVLMRREILYWWKRKQCWVIALILRSFCVRWWRQLAAGGWLTAAGLLLVAQRLTGDNYTANMSHRRTTTNCTWTLQLMLMLLSLTVMTPLLNAATGDKGNVALLKLKVSGITACLPKSLMTVFHDIER